MKHTNRLYTALLSFALMLFTAAVHAQPFSYLFSSAANGGADFDLIDNNTIAYGRDLQPGGSAEFYLHAMENNLGAYNHLFDQAFLSTNANETIKLTSVAADQANQTIYFAGTVLETAGPSFTSTLIVGEVDLTGTLLWSRELAHNPSKEWFQDPIIKRLGNGTFALVYVVKPHPLHYPPPSSFNCFGTSSSCTNTPVDAIGLTILDGQLVTGTGGTGGSPVVLSRTYRFDPCEDPTFTLEDVCVVDDHWTQHHIAATGVVNRTGVFVQESFVFKVDYLSGVADPLLVVDFGTNNKNQITYSRGSLYVTTHGKNAGVAVLSVDHGSLNVQDAAEIVVSSSSSCGNCAEPNLGHFEIYCRDIQEGVNQDLELLLDFYAWSGTTNNTAAVLNQFSEYATGGFYLGCLPSVQHLEKRDLSKKMAKQPSPTAPFPADSYFLMDTATAVSPVARIRNGVPNSCEPPILDCVRSVQSTYSSTTVAVCTSSVSDEGYTYLATAPNMSISVTHCNGSLVGNFKTMEEEHLNDQLGLSMKVVPNPTDGIFRVEFSEEISAQVQLLDIGGTLIRKTSVNESAQITMDLSRYPAGVYFVQIQTADGSETFEVMKTN